MSRSTIRAAAVLSVACAGAALTPAASGYTAVWIGADDHVWASTLEAGRWGPAREFDPGAPFEHAVETDLDLSGARVVWSAGRAPGSGCGRFACPIAVFTADTATGIRRRLSLPDGSLNWHPAVSGNGRVAAWVHVGHDGTEVIMRMPVSGGPVEVLGRGTSLATPILSRDGRTVAWFDLPRPRAFVGTLNIALPSGVIRRIPEVAWGSVAVSGDGRTIAWGAADDPDGATLLTGPSDGSAPPERLDWAEGLGLLETDISDSGRVIVWRTPSRLMARRTGPGAPAGTILLLSARSPEEVAPGPRVSWDGRRVLGGVCHRTCRTFVFATLPEERSREIPYRNVHGTWMTQDGRLVAFRHQVVAGRTLSTAVGVPGIPRLTVEGRWMLVGGGSVGP